MAESDISDCAQFVTRDEARAAGSKRYCTGLPCKRGHISDRYTLSRACTDCEILRADGEREERRLKSAEYRRLNPDKVRAQRAAQHVKHKDKNRESTKAWRIANSERFKSIRLVWNEANKERRAAWRKAWVAANRDKSRGYTKAWNAKNPDSKRVYGQSRRAKKLKAGGRFTTLEIRALALTQKYKCAECRIGINAGFHMDHIHPLSKGGGNSIKNIQLLCAPCNLHKSNKDPFSWARSKGRLL